MRLSRSAVIRSAGLLAALLVPLAFNPWAVYAFEPIKILVFECMTAAMLAAVLLGRGRWRIDAAAWRQRVAQQPLTAALLVYAGAIILATVFSIDPGLSLWGGPARPNGALVRLSGVAFCLLLATAVSTQANARRLLRVLVLGSVAVVLYGLVQAAGTDPLVWRSDSVSPVFATLGRSNFLGAYLAMLVPLTLYLLVTAGQASGRWRYGLIVALQVLCLTLTLARGAWLGLVGGCLVFVGVLAYRRRSRALVGLALLVLVAGSGWYVAMDRWAPAPDDLASVSAESTVAARRGAAVKARLVIWGRSLALAAARWPLGYGPATFETVFMAQVPPALAAFEGPQVVFDDPHNSELDQLLSGGVVTLLAWLGVVGLFYRQGWRALVRETDVTHQVFLASLLSAASAYLAQAQFNPDMMTVRMIFWMLVALQMSGTVRRGRGWLAG